MLKQLLSKNVVLVLVMAMGIETAQCADALDIDLKAAEDFAAIDDVVIDAYVQRLNDTGEAGDNPVTFNITGSIQSERILSKDTIDILTMDFDAKTESFINRSVILMRKAGKVQALFRYDSERSAPQDPAWQGDIASFYLFSKKYCIDTRKNYSFSAEDAFFCTEYEHSAEALALQDGFYLFAYVYPSKGGHLGTEEALASLDINLPGPLNESATCILFDDKRINIDWDYWQNQPFSPQVAKRCVGSVGALAGPFASEESTQSSLQDINGGWVNFETVFCRDQRCYFDYANMDLSLEVKQPRKIAVDVALNWVDPGFQSTLDKQDVFFYPIGPYEKKMDSWWMAYTTHSCFTSVKYIHVSREDCQAAEAYRDYFFPLPGKIQLPPGRYLVTAKATLNPVISEHESALVDSRIVELSADDDHKHIVFDFNDEHVERACPFVYSLIDGEETQQGEIIKQLVGPEAEATQTLPVQFTVSDGVITLIIREEKHETSYIDWLELSIDNEVLTMVKPVGALVEVDTNRLTLRKGEQIRLRFQVPERFANRTSGVLRSHGYYVPE